MTDPDEDLIRKAQPEFVAQQQQMIEDLPPGAIFCDTIPIYGLKGFGEHFRKLNERDVISLADGTITPVAGFVDPGEEYQAVAWPLPVVSILRIADALDRLPVSRALKQSVVDEIWLACEDMGEG